MYLASENLEKIPFSDQRCCTQFFYEFNMEKLDYFYVYKPVWHSFSTMNYQFLVDGVEICIPSGMYVLISDEYGDIDWIVVDEIIGRNIEFLVLNGKMTEWQNIKPVLQNCEDIPVHVPSSKHVLPLTDKNSSRIILICRSDQFKNTIGLTADDFLVG